jgi:hypothetical protein
MSSKKGNCLVPLPRFHLGVSPFPYSRTGPKASDLDQVSPHEWVPPGRARGTQFVSLRLRCAPLRTTPRKPSLLGTHPERVPTARGRGPSRGVGGHLHSSALGDPDSLRTRVSWNPLHHTAKACNGPFAHASPFRFGIASISLTSRSW